MFLITYKRGVNTEKCKIEFDHPLTFFNANEMLLEAVTKYKQTGQTMKISYKIIEIETGESVFNSKILIDHDISSLYQVIKENSNTPKIIVDYVTKVENREIIENEDDIFINNHEEKERLEKLKIEKNAILHQLKKEEKERHNREIEYQKKMKQILDEKKALEKSLQLKEKEEAVKESERLKSIKLLEEEKRRAKELIEEKRNLDKKRKEKHEERLKQVEEEVKKAEIELASIQAELDKKELERKKEIQYLENQKVEANRKTNILKSESDKEEIKFKKKLIDLQNHMYEDESQQISTKETPTLSIPKLTLKEKIQNLDLDKIKEFIKFSTMASITAIKKTYRYFKEYHTKRTLAKQEKLKLLREKLEIEERLNEEKIKFLKELKMDHLKHEKEIKKEVKQKEREALEQIKVENRYRAAKNRNIGYYPFYSGRLIRLILGIVASVVCTLYVIYYFDLGSNVAFLNELKRYMDQIITSFFSTPKS